MLGETRTAGIHAFALAGVTVLCLCLSLSLLSSPERAGAAQTSIIHGKTSKITDSPWQVALAVSRRVVPRKKSRARFF